MTIISVFSGNELSLRLDCVAWPPTSITDSTSSGETKRNVFHSLLCSGCNRKSNIPPPPLFSTTPVTPAVSATRTTYFFFVCVQNIKATGDSKKRIICCFGLYGWQRNLYQQHILLSKLIICYWWRFNRLETSYAVYFWPLISSNK